MSQQAPAQPFPLIYSPPAAGSPVYTTDVPASTEVLLLRQQIALMEKIHQNELQVTRLQSIVESQTKQLQQQQENMTRRNAEVELTSEDVMALFNGTYKGRTTSEVWIASSPTRSTLVTCGSFESDENSRHSYRYIYA